MSTSFPAPNAKATFLEQLIAIIMLCIGLALMTIILVSAFGKFDNVSLYRGYAAIGLGVLLCVLISKLVPIVRAKGQILRFGADLFYGLLLGVVAYLAFSGFPETGWLSILRSVVVIFPLAFFISDRVRVKAAKHSKLDETKEL